MSRTRGSMADSATGAPGVERPRGGDGGEPGRLSALIGMPRSGTTWLGSIINSHPEVAYRFEPIQRGSSHPEMLRLKEMILGGQVPPDFRRTIYEVLLRACPGWEKPPFFPKSERALPGRKLLWLLSRRSGPAVKWFERLYTPGGRPHLVFKELAVIGLLQMLVDEPDIRLVYLIRNPFAVVASYLKGIEGGLMPAALLDVPLRDKLEQYDPELAARYAGQVARLSLAERAALYWRLDCDWSLKVIQGRDRALLVVYHDLCQDPIGTAQAIFTHLGLSFHEQSRRFILESIRPRRTSTILRGPLGRRLAYFSVYRDPAQSENKWKTQLSEQQVAEVREIVQESAAYPLCPD